MGPATKSYKAFSAFVLSTLPLPSTRRSGLPGTTAKRSGHCGLGTQVANVPHVRAQEVSVLPQGKVLPGSQQVTFPHCRRAGVPRAGNLKMCAAAFRVVLCVCFLLR